MISRRSATSTDSHAALTSAALTMVRIALGMPLASANLASISPSCALSRSLDSRTPLAVNMPSSYSAASPSSLRRIRSASLTNSDLFGSLSAGRIGLRHPSGTTGQS